MQGEVTITLEDVEVLTRLPTRGLPVNVGLDRRNADLICQELLGATPPARSFQGHLVKISWVKGEFDHLSDGAPPYVVTCYARAYTWILLGAVLLADRSGDLIPVHLLRLVGDPVVASTFSWGSAVLAWLYKAMGRAAFFTGVSQKGTGDLGRFTLLVQLWALERFPHIADRYTVGGDPPVHDSVPRGVRWIPIMNRHQHRMVMRLEDIRYALDRCMEFVFGFEQRVPRDTEPAGRVEELLGLDFRASVQDWGAKYREYFLLWDQRGQHIATGEVRSDALSHHFHDEYDEWYRRQTRLALSHDGAQF
ncbi:Serine/threonine-protein phosphatase 7 long form homolog [Linum perenne]